jgi:cytidylate kinase
MVSESAPNRSAQSPSSDDLPETPRHGFQGGRSAPASELPASLTIALSREAGSRGASIGQRVGRKLGWQVYTQELLDYLAQEGGSSTGVLAHVPPAAARWAEERFSQLAQEKRLSKQASVLYLTRVILALGAQGEAVLIGRGAGYVLPAETTLHVRIVAPLADRVAYMSQWLRLTTDEAAERVRLLDTRRADFMQTHFQVQASDPCKYDLVLNSSLLGEELCVALIVQAARAKLNARRPASIPETSA